MPATARMPLEDQDPVVLDLLRLAAEVILAHPGAVPPALYDLCDTWADDLAGALSRPGAVPPRDPREPEAPMHGGQAATGRSPLTAGAGTGGVTEGATLTTAQGGRPR